VPPQQRGEALPDAGEAKQHGGAVLRGVADHGGTEEDLLDLLAEVADGPS